MNAPDVLNLAARLAPTVYQRMLDHFEELNLTDRALAEMVSAKVGFDVSGMARDEQIGLYLGHRLFVIANAASREFGRAAADRENALRRRSGDAA